MRTPGSTTSQIPAHRTCCCRISCAIGCRSCHLQVVGPVEHSRSLDGDVLGFVISVAISIANDASRNSQCVGSGSGQARRNFESEAIGSGCKLGRSAAIESYS